MIVSSRGRDAGHGRGVERSARRGERDVIFTRVSHHATGRGAAFADAVIAGAGSHLGAGAHREGGEDTGAPGAGAAGAKREARAARAQADGRGAAAHDEPRCG